ncbi:MAG: T9SS type A sorting domain-containing protein, partial [bacterium]|nr:T9SS type A sorting domain-containing protein [bacterium]
SQWKLFNQRLRILRNTRQVKLHVENELITQNITITNQQSTRVTVFIAFPFLTGAPTTLTIAPNIEYRYSEVTRELELISVPAGYSGTITASQWSGMPEPSQMLPDRYSLSVYPNPFNAMTNVKLYSTRAGTANLTMYDASGRVVRKLPRKFLRAPGSITFSLPAQQLPSGSYFITGSVAGAPLTTRVTILR